MTGGLLGDVPYSLADWGVTIAVDPAMPEGLMELRTSPDRPGMFMILPGTDEQRAAAEAAASERVQARVQRALAAYATQEAHRQWCNPPLPSPDSIIRPTEGDTP